MNDEALEIEFNKAVAFVSNYSEPLPADFLLRLYAYYKKANQDNQQPGSKKPIINAFKANALFQVRNVSEREAKESYIKLVNEYFKLT